MLMSQMDGKATIILGICIAVTLMLDVLFVWNFFTNDNIMGDTVKRETVASMYTKSYSGMELYQSDVKNQEEESNSIVAQKITIGEMENKAEEINAEDEEKTEIEEKTETKVKNIETEKTETKVKEKEEVTVTTKAKEQEQKKQVKKDNSKNEKKEDKISNTYQGLATIGKIEIPKSGINIPILSSVTIDGMEIAPCLLYETGDLNQSGNNVIVAHNYSNLFGNNKNLQNGDKIYITTLDGKRVEYEVYKKYTALSEDFSYARRDTNNKPEITLSTCTQDDDYRLIIWAKMV